MPRKACPVHNSKKDIHDVLGSVVTPGIMGNLQLHARTMVDILGLLGDVFFTAEHDCYSSFYQIPTGMVCFHAEKAEISMN